MVIRPPLQSQIAIVPITELDGETPPPSVDDADALPESMPQSLPQAPVAALPANPVVAVQIPETTSPESDDTADVDRSVAPVPANASMPKITLSLVAPLPPKGIEPSIESTMTESAPETVQTAAATVAEPAKQAIVQPPAQNGSTAISATLQTVPTPADVAVSRPEITLAARPERLAADVGVEIGRQFIAGRSEFAIRLDPPDLGRVDIRLAFDRGEVRAVVTTDNPATHDLLRRDAETLARMLTDSGFRTDSGALRFDLRQESGQRGFTQLASDNLTLIAEEAALPIINDPARSTRRGLVDLIA